MIKWLGLVIDEVNYKPKSISMKSFFISTLNKVVILFLMLCLGNFAIGQDSTSSSTSTSTSTDIKITSGQNESGDWYTSPWVWVLAGLGFILLLVALLRSGGNSRRAAASDSVTVTKTVSHDRDTDV